jgi:hypothetical protein
LKLSISRRTGVELRTLNGKGSNNKEQFYGVKDVQAIW